MKRALRVVAAAWAWLRAGYWMVADPPAPPPAPTVDERAEAFERLRNRADAFSARERPILRHWN